MKIRTRNNYKLNKDRNERTGEVRNIRTVAVRKRSFACRLREMGFEILAVRANRRYPEQNVYIFERSQDLDEQLTKMIAELEEREEVM